MDQNKMEINKAIISIAESLKKIAECADHSERIGILHTVIRIKEEYIRQKDLEEDYEFKWLPEQEKKKKWITYWEK
ncbi:hypothetical protein COV93_00840 [Candidatus Woesearchaeota archaeon CG11_big_fil_rev_8_21_14_0_20_43_8]|nr:MAG: hypothetical protein COV93_00840 [Candidatus Woesearchaeota archaeon CG11_big_fil_rev_8_21_14_0_20_43_8]PIO05220.1 MAG: hypothetical protein COT47_05660 [Candidatus Woesearchaeota archaeon CG08_land_8_20_14_0_20_43_7]